MPKYRPHDDDEDDEGEEKDETGDEDDEDDDDADDGDGDDEDAAEEGGFVPHEPWRPLDSDTALFERDVLAELFAMERVMYPPPPPMRPDVASAHRTWNEICAGMPKLKWVRWPLVLLALLVRPAQAQAVASLTLAPSVSRYLRLQYEAYGDREYLACLMGRVQGDTVVITAAAPADVDPPASTPRAVEPKLLCGEQWPSVVGIAHNHPGGIFCSHYLLANGQKTQYYAKDLHSFLYQPDLSVSLIVCGDHVTWIDRALQEHSSTWAELTP